MLIKKTIFRYLSQVFKVYKSDKQEGNSKIYTSCWNCKKKHFQNFLVCGGCKYLQDPSISIYKLSYFELFEIPKSYDLDKINLDLKFKKLQMSFHPDRQVQIEQNLLKYSQSFSAYVNEAYQTLKNDYKRAFYILQLEGYIKDDERKIEEDNDYLEKMLEIREEIEFSQDQNKLQEIMNENKIQKEQLLTEIRKNFQENKFHLAVDKIYKLQYLNAIENAFLTKDERH